MTRQYLSIEAFHDLLNKWNGKTIKIVKKEMNDRDEVYMELDAISYAKDEQTIDDYASMYTLQLNGDGQTMTADQYMPLPDSMFEIPLDDDTIYEFNGAAFVLQTNRGTYKIEQTQQIMPS